MSGELSAAAALRDAASTIEQLDAKAGVNPAQITAELVGRRGLSNATMDALRGLLSPHAAERIAALANASHVVSLEQLPTRQM